MKPKIIESDGDIFASGCEALVNPVDAATGAQGAGLAKAFKQRLPAQCGWYKRHASNGLAEPGSVYFRMSSGCHRLTVADALLNHFRADGKVPLVLFATTKAHFSRSSQLEWIRWCCYALVDAVHELGIRSIGLPALGCGEGRLAYDDIRPLILAAAQRMTCERVVLFRPKARAPRGRR